MASRYQPEAKPTAQGQMMLRGFRYLTLDPSPRLRKLREDQQRATKDPAQLVAEAWLSVGEAIRVALRSIRGRMTSPQ